MLRAPAFWWRKPGPASFLLAPAGALYGMVAAMQLARRGTRAKVPVICVGDPTVGGGGKTPAVIALAKMLSAAGEKPFVLSRGYGGRTPGPVLIAPGMDASEIGDEPLLLAAHAPTIVAADRVAGAKLAATLDASVIVLDDGFQNPSLEKDFSLLVIDAETGIGNGRVFPAGPLRAPLKAQLARAHGLILIGLGDAARELAEAASKRASPVFRARLVPDAAAANALARKRVLAFAGIGRPEKFFATLVAIGAEVVERRGFSDHHRFSPAEALSLRSAARAQNLQLVTTEKDLVRMRGDPALAKLAAAAKALPVTLEFIDPAVIGKRLADALAKAR
jgi:tetraacyldisaccharide 4'-kinase